MIHQHNVTPLDRAFPPMEVFSKHTQIINAQPSPGIATVYETCSRIKIGLIIMTCHYMWKAGGLEGYKKWWQTHMKIASWDLVPGIDTVIRAANWGLKALIAMLDRLLDSGPRYADQVQYGIFQKVRSTITNIVQAGAGGLEDLISTSQRNKVCGSRMRASTQNILVFQIYGRFA
jgi:hypothetical protein